MGAKGLIHLYYGNGKGKTTAALGLALRASGRGLEVVLVQFLKNAPSGELEQLARLPRVTVFRGGGSSRFMHDMDKAEKDATKARHDGYLKQALTLVEGGKCDLLILDEALDAWQLGVLDDELFRGAVTGKPPGLELVITGHKPADWVVDSADYVTEMVMHKHPYTRGIRARRGIEF